MTNKTGIRWETAGKIAIIVFALGMAFFFPFHKYIGGGKKAAQEEAKQDMTTAIMEKDEPARDYAANPEIFWRRNGEGFLLYVNGRQVSNLETSWSGDDLKVYHPATKRTYLLSNYAKVQDEQLREGEMVRE